MRIASASGASLGANTFTGLQTITQAAANAGILASTGYSLTGSNTTSMVNFAGTLNTSGVVDVLKVAITNTASAGSSNFLNFLGGASGTTSLFRVGIGGDVFGKAYYVTTGDPGVWTTASFNLPNTNPMGWAAGTNATAGLDTGMSRIAAGVIGAGTGAQGSLAGQFYGATLRTGQTTVAGLPAAATAGSGARAMVTDATQTLTAGIGAVVAGTGANIVPVVSDGTNWRIG